jgi:hypothetical protein
MQSNRALCELCVRCGELERGTADDRRRPFVACSYGQVDASILTSSTFRVGELLAEAEADPPLGEVALDPPLGEVALDRPVVAEDDADASSSVPSTWTLCPTCGVSFASSPSSRYSVPAVRDGVAEPLVPDVPAGLIWALVSMNFASVALLAAPDVPLVPVGLCAPRSTHPVTVIFFALADAFVLLCGVWAMRPATRPKLIATHVPDQILVVIHYLLFGSRPHFLATLKPF